MAYNEKNLGDGERIVHIAHKHVIVLFKAAAQWIALFIFAIIAAIVINAQPWDQTVKTVLLLVMLVSAFIAFIAFGISFLVWQAEQYILTNERVIQIEGIINKKEFGTSLEKINDVETDQSLLGRMLGYGTVEVLTGSDTGINKLEYLDKPQEFKKVMLNAKNRHYGDASDFAPGGPRYRDDGEGELRPRGRAGQGQGQVYDAPGRGQDVYGQGGQPYEVPPRSQHPTNGPDPRGYSQPRPQPQSYQQQPYVPTNGYTAPPQPQSQGQLSPQQIADSIQQLARLRDSGVISEAEFQAKKNELMNRL